MAKDTHMKDHEVIIGALVGTVHGLHNRGKIVEPFKSSEVTEREYEWHITNQYPNDIMVHVEWDEGKKSIVPISMLYLQEECEHCHWGIESNYSMRDGYCFSCNFWQNRAEERDDHSESNLFALAKNVYFNYGSNDVPDRYNLYVVYPGISNAAYRGSGGRKMTFHFIDGRVVESNNVWSRGNVPAHFVEYFMPFLAEIK